MERNSGARVFYHRCACSSIFLCNMVRYLEPSVSRYSTISFSDNFPFNNNEVRRSLRGHIPQAIRRPSRAAAAAAPLLLLLHPR